jgi:DNA-binding NarL/FixJ family response regulator
MGLCRIRPRASSLRCSGKSQLGGTSLRRLLQRIRRPRPAADQPAALAPRSASGPLAVAAARWSLTARQREVLALLAEGLATRHIAAELGISERTVGAHLAVMYEKAQVESRAELVARVWWRAG